MSSWTATVTNHSALTYVFGLIESLGNIPSQHGIHCAHYDQHDRVPEGDHVGGGNERSTNEKIIFPRRVVVNSAGRGKEHPDPVDQNLEQK